MAKSSEPFLDGAPSRNVSIINVRGVLSMAPNPPAGCAQLTTSAFRATGADPRVPAIYVGRDLDHLVTPGTTGDDRPAGLAGCDGVVRRPSSGGDVTCRVLSVVLERTMNGKYQVETDDKTGFVTGRFTMLGVSIINLSP